MAMRSMRSPLAAREKSGLAKRSVVAPSACRPRLDAVEELRAAVLGDVEQGDAPALQRGGARRERVVAARARVEGADVLGHAGISRVTTAAPMPSDGP